MTRTANFGCFLRSAFLIALALLCLGAGRACAQVDTGAILGTVTDSSGAAVSGATVTLKNEGTNASLSMATSEDGTYKFSPVRIGTYTIEATLQGFKKTEVHAITVNVNAQVVVDLHLTPGTVTENIEVVATAPLLQSQDASVGQVVAQQSVNDLPLNGRNFTFLAQLSAGVNTPQADTRGNAATGAFAANGFRPAQNNYMLDGIDNNSDTVDFLNGTNFVVNPPIDAVQEFKVQTSNFSAEFGRSGAAVLNASIKSGTNDLHGDLWEFFRNDKLDAADFFENALRVPRGELRQNQFGFTIGGPVVIPKVFDGRNKVFFFGDYEGFRRVQGTPLFGSVPTAAERSSGFTDLSDLIVGQDGESKARPDALGRSIPLGTILDPATTRAVTAGQVDPVSGLTAAKTGYVRDPFGTCAAGTLAFTLGGCALNQLPAGRLDPNAIKLLSLYPTPTNGKLFSNFASSPALYEHRNSFDTRMDFVPNDSNQVFFRFSYVDDPQFIPSIFGGVADGGGFYQGNQTANAQQSALAYTHTFDPTLVNVARIGFNYLHTSRVSPEASNLTDIPSQFGIQGVPQQSLNGGLPAFGINGLQTLGSNAFLPSDEVSSTFQLTDDVTKILGKHTFKGGFEWQHVKFSTLQPPWSRGEFDYNGNYTDIPNVGGGNTGRAAFLLAPIPSTVPGGVNDLGGSTQIYLSNISLTDNGKDYVGLYLQDDWRLTQRLTINLGLRWDYFGLVFEHHDNQANFVPGGPPTGAPMYLMPPGPGNRNTNNLSPSFVGLLAQDGITLAATNAYGRGLGNAQTNNFAPRLGLAYQATPKLVVRAAFGLFYNGFENRGFSPNIGENYPFQFNFSFPSPNDFTPITFPACPTAGPGGTATFETGFSCTPLSPLLVNASGLTLRGIQFDYKTPYSMGGNFTLQYQVTPSLALSAGYVTTQARHLEVFPGSNLVGTLADPTITAQTLVPYPDFSRGASYASTEGNSIYHGLQTKLEKRFGGGLTFLFTYTYSQVRTDAHDLLNGGNIGFNSRGGAGGGDVNSYRAPGLFGIHPDYQLAPFDIRNVVHFSGTYELPFGQGKHFASSASGITNKVIGGWSFNWLATLQGGQPITLGCPTLTASGVGCGDLLVKGQPLKLGLHNDSNELLSWFGNPAAFAQPCVLGAGLMPITGQPTGCVPLSGIAALGAVNEVPGPGFHRLDFSLFKQIPLTERFRMEFRTEVFNIFNHPNFNSPGFGGNGVVAIPNSLNFNSSNFGEIGSTRDAPYDPRQIQFALKLYF